MSEDSSRRRFLRGVGATGASGVAAGCAPDEEGVAPAASVPLLPPPNARVQTTACAHCVVGCGYKVYDWPVAQRAGLEDAQYNALGADFPVSTFGPWISPQMINQVTIDGEP
ncbi:MAG: hypothetical protein ACI9WU_001685, partial [Myxococcota bacterium]